MSPKKTTSKTGSASSKKTKAVKKAVRGGAKKTVRPAAAKPSRPQPKKAVKKTAVKKAAAKKAIARKTTVKKTRVRMVSPSRFHQALGSWWQRLKAQMAGLYQREPETIWLAGLMLVAAGLRFIQPDWYMARQFHPDERWIVGVVSQLSYPQEPAGLQYGTFPMYLLALIKDLVATAAGWFGHFDVNRFTIWAGRMLSACFDLGTIVFTYLIGRRLRPGQLGRQIGLMAAALLTFTVLNIQMAHFFVVDVPLGLLATATLYWSILIAQEGRRRDYVLAGLMIGLALATKTSAFPLVAAVGMGHLLGLNQSPVSDRVRRWQELGLAVGVSLVTFFIAMPYAFLDWSKFWSNQQEQQRILVTGKADVPYNRQYLHTTAYLYYFRNLIRYTQGWSLGLLSVLAILLVPLAGIIQSARLLMSKQVKAWRRWLNRESVLLVLMAFAILYFAIVGHAFAKFNRYMLPLTPIFSLIVAWVLMQAYHGLRVHWQRRLGQVVLVMVLANTILWALAFVSIYQQEHPWIAASRWIQTHVPEKTMKNGIPFPTAILNEEWGDDLPTYVPGLAHTRHYAMNKFAVQEPDTPAKRQAILAMLQKNDLIVMADTRAHAVYRRLPERYPINAAYYQLMFEGRLGFHLAAEFTDYPRLFGHEFSDDDSDESFTLYDHPHVYLFARDRTTLSARELASRLDKRIVLIKAQGQHPRAPVKTVPKLKHWNMTKKEPMPTVINNNIDQPEVRPVFLLGRINSFKAGLMWVLLMEVIGLLTLPLCLSLFPRLPDAGAALSKIIGSLILGWTIWMLVSLGVIPHVQAASFLVLVVLGAISLTWAWKRKLEIETFFREKGRLWLLMELIFLLAFVGYMVTKLYNPDINNPTGQGYNGGGEPMGISFFSAVYQSLHFPPYDPWLSGYHINYYYYGQLILGILAKLAGVPPVWSYQIVISLLFALTFTGVFGLGLALTGKKRWGLFSAVAAAMLGNMHTYFYMLEPINRGLNWNNLGQSLAMLWKSFWLHLGRFEFIWNPTRLIKGTINEMPWFSFLYGDLHAHIIAIPYSLPLIGWAANLLTPVSKTNTVLPEVSGRTGTERGLSFFVTALTLGALSAINTWNFPPYALLVLAVLIVQALQDYKGGPLPWRALGKAVLGWLRLVVGGLVLLLYFHIHFKPQSTSLALVNPAVRTHLKEFMIFFSLPLFLLISFTAQHLVSSGRALLSTLGWKPRSRKPWWQKVVAILNTFWAKYPVAVYIILAALLGAGLLLLFNQVTLVVLGLLVLALIYVLVWKPLAPGLRLAMIMAMLGFLIVLGCEIVHVRDFMGVGGDMSRMNTVFKFYMVVWIYLALAAGAVAHHLLEGSSQVLASWRKVFVQQQWLPWLGYLLGLFVLAAMANYQQENTGTPWLTWLLFSALILLPLVWAIRPELAQLRRLWMAVLGFVLITVALYPPIALYNRMHLCSNFEHPTLNGVAYLERLLPKEAKALRWIDEHVDRMAIILEAPGKRGYNCFDTRIAIFTGHPSLIGWVGQEEQMRYNGLLTGSRTEDADRIYRTLSIKEAQALLRRYHVGYVFVGLNEQAAYPRAGLEKLGRFMDLVYDQDGIKIYQMRQYAEEDTQDGETKTK